MSEDTARAVGAPSPTTVMIAGKECHPRPLNIKELGEIERECLKQYKRQYLETYKENADLLPEGEATRLMVDKMDQVAKWGTHNLPLKDAYDPSRIRINDKLMAWVVENYDDYLSGQEKEEDEKKRKTMAQRLIATALDNGTLSEDAYEDMAGRKVSKVQIGYVNWWITGAYDGMMELVYTSFKQYGVTRDDVGEALARNPTMLVGLSREIESLSTPQMGNS